MRREVACTLLLASAAAISTTATATATGEKNIQVHLPTIPRPYPRARSFKNGLRLHPNAAVNIDGREPQPCHQNHPCNDRRLASDPGARGARGGCLTSRRARAAGPLGLVQPCFLQPCLSPPVVRERGGLKVGFSTCEKPERSAMRCRRQRVESRSAKRRSGDKEEEEEEGNGGGGGDGARRRNGGAPMPRMVSWGLNSRSQPSARKALGSGSKTHTTVHVCEVCGSEHVQWVGRCPTCKEWNCVKPFKVRREQGANPSRISRPGYPGGVGVGSPGGSGADPEFGGLGGGAFGGGVGWLPTQGVAAPTRLSDVGEVESQERLTLPGSELPRVLGGGLVPGSMVMLGGDPGVGKSTLLLQLAGQLASFQPRHDSSTTSSMGESDIDDDDGDGDDDDDSKSSLLAEKAARESGGGDESDPLPSLLLSLSLFSLIVLQS